MPPTLSQPIVNQTNLAPLIVRHIRLGWWSLAIFLTLGIAIEVLHGLKASVYLDVSNHTRRLMWTLAHAHGTLIGLVQFGFAFTLYSLPQKKVSSISLASSCFVSAGLLIPTGFLLGGAIIHGGDPGLGVLLVPIGALLLLTAVLLTLWSYRELPTDRERSAETLQRSKSK